MMAQLTLATVVGVVGVADGVADGQGVAGAVEAGAVVVGVAVAVTVGVADVVTVGVAVAAGDGDAVAVGVAAALAAGAAAAGTAVPAAAGTAVPAAAGTAVPVAAGTAVALGADVMVGADVTVAVGAGEAVEAGAVAVGVVQPLARFAALPEVPSAVPECEAIRIAIPTPRAITMSPATAARRARGRCSNPP
jgi:hypothetical protein